MSKIRFLTKEECKKSEVFKIRGLAINNPTDYDILEDFDYLSNKKPGKKEKKSFSYFVSGRNYKHYSVCHGYDNKFENIYHYYDENYDNINNVLCRPVIDFSKEGNYLTNGQPAKRAKDRYFRS